MIESVGAAVERIVLDRSSLMHVRLLLFGLALALICNFASSARAAEDDSSFQLPASPAKWVNSGPISLQALEGKGAVLWFYEESCPNCRAKWPPLLALAKRYEGQPVVFIGVNSGNSRAAVEQYARGVRCNWPIIVDDTREFEAQCGIKEINLQNIHQVGYITPEGQFQQGNWSDLDGVVDKALTGASWKVEPAGIPPALRPAWLSVEFGNPAAAAPAIKKGLSSPQGELKQAATQLNEVVRADMDRLADEAKEKAEEGDKWGAFKTYQLIAAQYGSFDVSDEIKAAARELGADDQVKKELAAQKAFEAAMKAGNSARTPNARKSAITRLKKIADEFGGTEASEQAAKVLGQDGD
jgi:thiol-disulfide isomerase/thioredoxin